MKPLNLVLLASLIAIGGKWAQHRTIDTKMVVGGAFISLFFVVAQDAQPKFAESFGWLILATSVGAYGQELFGAVGNVTTGTAGGTAASPGTNRGSGLPTGSSTQGK